MNRAVLAAALALLATWPNAASAEGNAERGAASYNADCAGCHRDAAAIAAAVDGDSEEDRSAELESFLTRHFAPDADVRADIIAYLMTLDE